MSHIVELKKKNYLSEDDVLIRSKSGDQEAFRKLVELLKIIC
jgi:hypothetical protein